MENIMEKCNLCPRNCNVFRDNKVGFCGVSNKIKIAKAYLHMWEEPCISGDKGSGTVFFTGCNLKCIYCQNHKIALSKYGKEISINELVDIFFMLKEKGANNINLVTPSHYVLQLKEALTIARQRGLGLPIVYNTSSYEKVESLKMLEGLIDVYLPDLKYVDSALSCEYSHAKDYFDVASLAIKEMYRQVGNPEFDADGIIKKGVIVRHLILPGHIEDSKNVIKYLYDTYGDNIYISIMNQYTPLEGVKDIPKLNRKLTDEEYDEVVDFAIDIGVENGFIQEGETALESFIPDFDF
ncbi:MAG: radical SAM protein [Lachnospiraceae bacterium]|nr:radical SAM protein [Lachnospiraceae bacterium]